MSLFTEWKALYENQTQETFPGFWETYTSAEQRIYEDLLGGYPEHYKGVVGELATKCKSPNTIFAGFLDGIYDSLSNPEALDLEAVDENTEIDLDVDFEKLYFNMLDAKAEYLYTLPQWENIFTQEKRDEITDKWRNSKTFVRTEAKIGRNDLCPCGSGKKYKKCCGKNVPDEE